VASKMQIGWEVHKNRRVHQVEFFSVGSATVSWYNMKQRFMAHNSAKVEYLVASQATCEAIWMRKILVGLFGQMMDSTVI